MSATPEIISDLEARQIADAWHVGMRSPLYALQSTGAIVSDGMYDVAGEISDLLMPPTLTPEEREELRALLAYVEYHGHRPAQVRWADRLSW